MDTSGFEEALRILGASRIEAALVAALMLMAAATTKALRTATGLAPSDISSGIQELRSRGWITVDDLPRAGKGRPQHVYRLGVHRRDIIAHYQHVASQGLATIQTAMQRVAQLAVAPTRT